MPAPTAAERDRALRAAIAEAHRYGVTSVQDATGSADELAAYAEARRTGDLQVRSTRRFPVVERSARRRPRSAAGDHREVSRRSALQSRRARPDPRRRRSSRRERRCCDSRSLHFQADDFNRLVRRLDARGWQIVTDAASDVAVRMTLNAYEHAVRSNPDRKRRAPPPNPERRVGRGRRPAAAAASRNPGVDASAGRRGRGKYQERHRWRAGSHRVATGWRSGVAGPRRRSIHSSD